MITTRVAAACALIAMLVAGSAQAAPKVDGKAIEAAAHGAYLAAINSNNVDKLMATVTDDIVYQSPGEPEIVGKDAVRKWAAGYVDAYSFKWEKTSLGFTVSGDWAFERTPTR
jgi:ketosteroid isomerase-like protein